MKTLWAFLVILALHIVSISGGKARSSFSRHGYVYKGAPSFNQWHIYKKTFGKSYSSMKEETFRRKIFEKNVKTINDWNELHRQGEVSYKVGLNKWADRTSAERKASKAKLEPFLDLSNTEVLDLSPLPTATQFQWSQYFTLDNTTCISPVRDQRNCASGYAIAAVTLLEYVGCKTRGTFQSFSLDQVLDCSTYSQGCNGGYYEEVFKYFTENSIMPDALYRPRNNRVTKCKYDSSVGIGKLAPYAIFKLGLSGDPNNVNAVIYGATNALKAFGPIAGRFDSGGRNSLFDFYQSGVYDDPNCANFLTNGNNATDHTLVLVGVGVTDAGQPVWIAQNSMGTDWGDNGRVYLPLFRNTCNIERALGAVNQYVSFVTTA